MNNSERALEDEEARLAAASLATGDPTGWFDRLYAAGAAGRVPLPWSRREPHPLLTEWAQRHHLAGQGKRAIVPGCGLGADAEYLAGLGFTTTAFDISPTAIRLARHRHPDSPVEYVTADLLHLPRPWLRAFDLVAEIITVQALPRAVRHRATTSVARLTAPSGTLLVIAAVHNSAAEPQSGPPWPLTRAEIGQFAADGLTPAATGITTMPDASGERRWRAEFHADGNSARPLVSPASQR
jgi:cyclopropane fatty-acyl-phospholipid synthase-like methyltransferase